ncbi:hypothetical protein [Streptomonospora alba]|nr:hypothetical protein [Streptomonospora alba]
MAGWTDDNMAEVFCFGSIIGAFLGLRLVGRGALEAGVSNLGKALARSRS